MSSHNTQSRVINAPLEKVWSAIRSQNFEFWTIVKQVDQSSNATEVGSTRKVTFADDTVQVYRLVEFSELANSLSYEIVESSPAVEVLSALHTIRVFRVTADNSSFVQWTSEFSSAGSSEAVEDSKYKKQEALSDLAKALEN